MKQNSISDSGYGHPAAAEIGAWLRQLRVSKGLSQQQMAARLGISVRELAGYEASGAATPGDTQQGSASSCSAPLMVSGAPTASPGLYHTPLSTEEWRLIEHFRALGNDALRSRIVTLLANMVDGPTRRPPQR